jgi:hypothetical protein
VHTAPISQLVKKALGGAITDAGWLALRAVATLAEAAGNTTLADTFRAEAATMARRVRSGAGGETPGDEWWRPLGLHAAAHAANAGLINASEAPRVFAARFNDSSKVCSFSNFNQFFVLQGIANLGFPRHGARAVALQFVSVGLGFPYVTSVLVTELLRSATARGSPRVHRALLGHRARAGCDVSVMAALHHQLSPPCPAQRRF